MTLIQIIHDRIQGSDSRDISLDARWIASERPLPIVVFAHGYKGFKDWGCWNLVANKFAEAGFLFIKFNFSHNGTTVASPTDFVDEEAFGNNNYSKELFDLKEIIKWTSKAEQLAAVADTSTLHLVGHSRGGGISLLAAGMKEVKSFATWASVPDFASRFPFGHALKEWKEKGVFHVLNARTGQQLPHFIQFFDDFVQHEEKLDIRTSTKLISKPFLILHGSEDEAVHISEAMRLNKWGVFSSMYFVQGASHTFGAKHPWEKEQLPVDLDDVVERTIAFFK